jgi:hypothetical protein
MNLLSMNPKSMKGKLGKKSGFLSAILLVAIVLLILSSVRPVISREQVSEANQILLIVRPLVAMNHSKVQNEALNLNITAINATSLHEFKLNLSYDTAVVNCTNVQEGDLLEAAGNTTMQYTIDNMSGNLYVSANLTSADSTSGNGTLVELTFLVTGEGETTFHVYDVTLYDAAGSALSYVTYDGYFNNKVNLDFSMPLILLAVSVASVLLNGKVEGRLKGVLEEREFRVRDAILLVGMMTIMIGLIVVVRQLSLILMVLFLFSYSMLLFIFGYLFSKNRWYVGIIAPTIFILLYVFFRDSYVWTYYLSNIVGVFFAILITLYLASLFTWKTTAVFGVLITGMDIVLVLITGTMVEAANAARSLSLPVLVSAPLLPPIVTGNGILLMSLGLGDFFFAGLLAIQSYKKYGRPFAFLCIIAMTVSFFAFEAFILTFNVRAFPGTLMIICGWVPLILYKQLRNRKTREKANQ